MAAESGPSLADAFGVLESNATSSRAHASIKTLRAEMEVGDAPKREDNESPGQKAARRVAPNTSFSKNASKLAAGLRMKGQKT